MSNLSQAVFLPAPWPISLTTFVVYAAVEVLLLSTSYVRKGSENVSVWPLQAMAAIRMTGAIFACVSDSTIPSIAAHQRYMLLMFTYLWDVGFLFLLLQQMTSFASVHRLNKDVRFQAVKYTGLAVGILVATVAHAGQGSNVTKSLAYSHNPHSSQLNLFSPSTIMGFLKVYWVLCVVAIVCQTPEMIYRLTFPRRWTKLGISTADLTQLIAFIISFPLLAIYFAFSFRRLWQQTAPSTLIFGTTQLLTDALITLIYAGLAFMTAQWDHWRQTEVEETREYLKSFWDNKLMDAISYAHSTNSSDLARPKPWILTQAEERFKMSAVSNHPKDQTMIQALLLLKKIAVVIAENVMLEPELRDSLWKKKQKRKVDIQATEQAAIKTFMDKFRPMTEDAASRLARDWTKVFSEARASLPATTRAADVRQFRVASLPPPIEHRHSDYRGERTGGSRPGSRVMSHLEHHRSSSTINSMARSGTTTPVFNHRNSGMLRSGASTPVFHHRNRTNVSIDRLSLSTLGRL
ncbi:hypothetical protein BT63DRAFT_7332 [Microthyrium microscopicum]|uniref:Uncharacterized protein n=1 Tax=Microthyrium microscopicum TaxID=703497 RepID=A0A6A6UPU6_9PEZI|nr:hypothetical protein BT63DRAFT_7332 [Microthyrium microscopicum]